MIYVDLSSFVPNDDWRYTAWQLTQELISAVDKQTFIKDNESFWGAIKNDLPLSHKCWFTEETVGGFPYQVEHFRPKDGVRRISKRNPIKKLLKSFEEENRNGWTQKASLSKECYWWLAFEHTNFRIVASLINSKKGNFFPIKQGTTIMYSPSDNIANEIHILLDPTKENDPQLLTFDNSGNAIPSKNDKTDFDYVRAFVSISIYGLNSYPFLVQKRVSKWKECEKAIKRANIKYIEMERVTDLDNFNNLYDEFIDFVDSDIKPSLSPLSEFSAVAMACVKSYSYEWIQDYVLN